MVTPSPLMAAGCSAPLPRCATRDQQVWTRFFDYSPTEMLFFWPPDNIFGRKRLNGPETMSNGEQDGQSSQAAACWGQTFLSSDEQDPAEQAYSSQFLVAAAALFFRRVRQLVLSADGNQAANDLFVFTTSPTSATGHTHQTTPFFFEYPPTCKERQPPHPKEERGYNIISFIGSRLSSTKNCRGKMTRCVSVDEERQTAPVTMTIDRHHGSRRNSANQNRRQNKGPSPPSTLLYPKYKKRKSPEADYRVD